MKIKYSRLAVFEGLDHYPRVSKQRLVLSPPALPLYRGRDPYLVIYILHTFNMAQYYRIKCCCFCQDLAR